MKASCFMHFWKWWHALLCQFIFTIPFIHFLVDFFWLSFHLLLLFSIILLYLSWSSFGQCCFLYSFSSLCAEAPSLADCHLATSFFSFLLQPSCKTIIHIITLLLKWFFANGMYSLLLYNSQMMPLLMVICTEVCISHFQGIAASEERTIWNVTYSNYLMFFWTFSTNFLDHFI